MSAMPPPPATETDWLAAYLDAANRLSRAYVELRDLRRENDRLREFIAALPAPPPSRHFEEVQA